MEPPLMERFFAVPYLSAPICWARRLLWRLALFLWTRFVFAALSSTLETLDKSAFASSFLPPAIATRMAFNSDFIATFTLRLRAVRLIV